MLLDISLCAIVRMMFMRSARQWAGYFSATIFGYRYKIIEYRSDIIHLRMIVNLLITHLAEPIHFFKVCRDRLLNSAIQILHIYEEVLLEQ